MGGPGGQVNWKVLGAGIALVVPLVWVLASGFGSDPQYIPCPLIDKPAPTFTLPVLDGDAEERHREPAPAFRAGRGIRAAGLTGHARPSRVTAGAHHLKALGHE